MLKTRFERRAWLVSICGVCLIAAQSAARDFNPSTFLKLPKHCQAGYASAARKGTLGNSNVDLRQYEMNLRQEIGNPAIFMNHYCPALERLIELSEQNAFALDPEERKKTLIKVLKGIDYQLTQPKYNERNIWLKAEALTNKGRTLLLLNRPQQAIKNFANASAAWPAYLPAYWELSQLYASIGKLDAAISSLEEAQSNTSNEKYRAVIEERLDQYRSQLSEMPDTETPSS